MKRVLASWLIHLAMWSCGVAAAQGGRSPACPEAQGFRIEGRHNKLEIVDTTSGQVLKRIPVAAADGKRPSRVATVCFAATRQSFVVSFEALPEVWEISIDPKAPDLYQGLVHDFRMGEGVPERGYLGVRRTRLDAPLPEFVLDGTGAYVLGCRVDSPVGQCSLMLLHLDVRRRIGQFALQGKPDLGRSRAASGGTDPSMELVDQQGVLRWHLDLRNDRLIELSAPKSSE
ncbi:MAG: hypothetical protein JNM76_17650 [Betaproteobacteria bacterium]|nr:hypothetical protein [Betaproteobacteria bacterium]